jgi:diadenosine tetraphosphate (Ap4A) HIT family hydrolase
MLERKRKKEDCTFCNLTEEDLKKKIEIKNPKTGEKQILDCNRGFYDQSNHCIVTLAPEQYSIGHTLVILWNHSEDLSDNSVEDIEYVDLCKTIRNVSNILKNKLDPKPERIYVNSLCDGVEHLHFHLIPRYKTDVRGFNFVGDREKLFNIGFTIGPEPKPSNFESRAKWIASIAGGLRK